MLYEVITAADMALTIRTGSLSDKLISIKRSNFSLMNSVTAGFLGVPKNEKSLLLRITSYNVCYTKLLRQNDFNTGTFGYRLNQFEVFA